MSWWYPMLTPNSVRICDYNKNSFPFQSFIITAWMRKGVEKLSGWPIYLSLFFLAFFLSSLNFSSSWIKSISSLTLCLMLIPWKIIVINFKWNSKIHYNSKIIFKLVYYGRIAVVVLAHIKMGADHISWYNTKTHCLKNINYFDDFPWHFWELEVLVKKPVLLFYC